MVLKGIVSALNLRKRAYRRIRRDSRRHREVALQAAREAMTVLRLFEADRPDDPRPRDAVVAIRAWAKGQRELGMHATRRLSLDAHAAARAAKTDAARFAARAAGHAVATWHVPAHALGSPLYAEKARAANREISISLRLKSGETARSRRKCPTGR